MTDPRQEQALTWLKHTLQNEEIILHPASEDAGFRRYFRVKRPNQPDQMLMDCPPDKEDVKPFIHVAGLLQQAKVLVPDILAQHAESGFLLITDLGEKTFLQTLKPTLTDDTDVDYQLSDHLMTQAIDTLVNIQQFADASSLPVYDDALLRRELTLFTDWFLIRHCQLDLTDDDKTTINDLFEKLIARALSQPKTFVHRDYMVRNLMVSQDNRPGVIDFQDAVSGPITYDCASLFQDAFISWDEELTLDWLIKYREKAKAAGLPVGSDIAAFYDDYQWMAMQRHLKVLGIFCRLHYRDGKSQYLSELPRFYRYVRQTARRYNELAALLPLLDRAEEAFANVQQETKS